MILQNTMDGRNNFDADFRTNTNTHEKANSESYDHRTAPTKLALQTAEDKVNGFK
jgi:hypothetical protein